MRRTTVGVIVVMAALAVASCGGGQENTGGGQGVEIAFASQPDPPTTEENTFAATVTQNGVPVTDAEVAVEFYMPAMPSMNMAEMRNSVPLKHESGGRYTGAGRMMMAGRWDATVTVTRGGQVIGSEKLPVTAK
jgi:hypothetical protein